MPAATKTQEIMESFYGSVTPDAEAGGFTLLPTTVAEGAPEGNRYLMEFTDPEVKEGGDNSNNPGRPYVNVRLAVVEPDFFEGQGFFTMFYLPVPPTDDMKPSKIKSTNANTARLFGQLDRILGEGTALELFSGVTDDETLREAMDNLVDQLDGERIVAEVKVQKPKKDSGYDAQNVVKQYHEVDTWEGEED